MFIVGGDFVKDGLRYHEPYRLKLIAKRHSRRKNQWFIVVAKEEDIHNVMKRRVSVVAIKRLFGIRGCDTSLSRSFLYNEKDKTNTSLILSFHL